LAGRALALCLRTGETKRETATAKTEGGEREREGGDREREGGERLNMRGRRDSERRGTMQRAQCRVEHIVFRGLAPCDSRGERGEGEGCALRTAYSMSGVKAGAGALNQLICGNFG
jgi:hypothetical protein